MSSTMKAIEVMGTIDEQQQLQLNEALPLPGPSRVRVIVLVLGDDDLGEREWLRAATTSPAFDFLKENEEDIYSLADGKPFTYEG